MSELKEGSPEDFKDTVVIVTICFGPGVVPPWFLGERPWSADKQIGKIVVAV
jgi:hypothetical protein